MSKTTQTQDIDDNLSKYRPVHLAIIMDGNNRWAKQRGLDQITGHRQGAQKLKKLIEYLDKFPQIKHLTVFAFSSENWKRSATEVNSLMSLFYTFLGKYRQVLIDLDVRLRIIGKRDKFSKKLNKLIAEVETETSKFSRHLVLAVDYGGKWDIANAAKIVAQKVASGTIEAKDVDEDLLGKYIAISDIPPPDLLIRTGGEQRISNFLLWQIAYSEIFIIDDYWPDFNEDLLRKSLNDFWHRSRRFGGSGKGDEYKKVDAQI